MNLSVTPQPSLIPSQRPWAGGCCLTSGIKPSMPLLRQTEWWMKEKAQLCPEREMAVRRGRHHSYQAHLLSPTISPVSPDVPPGSIDASLPMEKEEHVHLQAWKQLKEQLQQYKVKQHQEQVNPTLEANRELPCNKCDQSDIILGYTVHFCVLLWKVQPTCSWNKTFSHTRSWTHIEPRNLTKNQHCGYDKGIFLSVPSMP